MLVVTQSSKQIVGGFNRKEKWATDRIYNEFSPQIIYSIRQVTSNRHEIEDLSQEVFKKLLEQRGRFKNIRKIRSFILLTTNHLCQNFQRNQTAFEMNRTVFKKEYMNTGENKIEEAEGAIHLQVLIADAIDKLPAYCRDIFKYYFRDRMTNKETSEKLGISEKTVANNKTQAMKLLKFELEPKRHLLFSILFL